MSKPEVDRLFGAIAEIRGRGAGVLYVSHRLEEVFKLGDRVSVLREGRLVLSREVADTTEPVLVEAIAGRAVEEVEIPDSPDQPDVALSVRDLAGRNLNGVSFDLAKGEIVGVTGLAGSGVDELAETLVGGLPIEGGTIARAGSPMTSLTPRRARELGMALLPANRAVKACIPAFSVRENITLPLLRPLRTLLGINRRQERAEVLQWMQRVELRPPEPERTLASLSGGNQQKAVIARWLRLRPQVLVLHEPTQGVDIGAKAAIHRLLAEAARNDAAVIACSCDVVDLTKLCQRVLILEEGRVVDELRGDRVTEDNVWTCLLRSRPSGAHLIDDREMASGHHVT